MPEDRSSTKFREGGRESSETIRSARGREDLQSRLAVSPIPAAANRLKQVGSRVVHATVQRITAAVSRKFHHWASRLGDAVARASPRLNAALEAISAALKGKKPLWAAIKAAVSALSFRAKILLTAVLVLALLLGPVLLVALLVALIVAGVVAAARTRPFG